MNIESQNQAYIELSRDEVARRARQLWNADGRPARRNLEYWLQAEVELLSVHQRRGLSHQDRSQAAYFDSSTQSSLGVQPVCRMARKLRV
jgi:Protein of unknown function (DUF2934)